MNRLHIRGMFSINGEEGVSHLDCAMNRRGRRILACLVLVFSVISTLPAQQQENPAGKGQIRVQVRDPNGHGLEADGKLAGPSKHLQSVHSSPEGVISISGLAFGHYYLEVSAPGFGSQTLDLDVTSSTLVRRELTLEVASTTTSIDVVGATPIGPLNVPLADVPLPVQTLTSKTIEDTNAIDLTGAMFRRMNGVFVNENQNNPFQPDVNYRGYTASPLVGSQQGLSVYLDGVRQNEPFGDVVAWDLIPKVAIASTELMINLLLRAIRA